MTNAEREQLRELAERNYDDVLIGDLQDGIRSLLTALDSAEKREKELELRLEEHRFARQQSSVRAERAESALSTERERVIEECAKVAESYRSITPANEVIAAELRALRSPEVAKEERK